MRTRGDYFGADDRHRHRGDRAHQPHGRAPHRLRHPAQQGHRRAQRLRPRVAASTRPALLNEASHLRDHEAGRRRPHRQRPRAGQALRAPRAARPPGRARLRAVRRRARRGLPALQGRGRQEEGRHRARPRGAGRARRSASARTSFTLRSLRQPVGLGDHAHEPGRGRGARRAAARQAASATARSRSVFKAIDNAVGMQRQPGRLSGARRHGRQGLARPRCAWPSKSTAARSTARPSVSM